MLKNSLYISITIINFIFCNSISIPTIELEGEYEKRYTSALNSVLGPENFYIEVKANFKQKLAVKKENDIPINFLPGLGIKTQSIPQEIKPNENKITDSIESIDINLNLEITLTDSLVSLATQTIKNHILYKKIKNNLVINKVQLYKSPEILPVDVVWPINTYDPEQEKKSIFSDKSIIGSFFVGIFIVIAVIVLLFFINKLYKKFIDFSQSQLEGQDAVRLALEEGLSNPELIEEDKILIDSKANNSKENFTNEVTNEPIQNIPVPDQNSTFDTNLETTLREVGADIIDAISNIAEPVTSSVKEAISESTSLELKQENPFDFISYLDIDINKKIFMNENEGSCAIVLSHLEPKKASEILAALDVNTRLKIAQHMATMEGTSKEILNSVKTKFRNKVKELLKPDFKSINGVNILSNILNEMNQEDSEGILFSISQTNKTISDNIRKNIGYFNDILSLNNDQIDKLINQIDTNTLASSLINAEENIQNKIFNSLSSSGQFALKRRIQLLEHNDINTIEIAQKKVGEKIISLLDNNE